MEPDKPSLGPPGEPLARSGTQSGAEGVPNQGVLPYQSHLPPRHESRFYWVTALVAIPCGLWVWGMFALAFGQREGGAFSRTFSGAVCSLPAILVLLFCWFMEWRARRADHDR
jgi:hypothetical protein